MVGQLDRSSVGLLTTRQSSAEGASNTSSLSHLSNLTANFLLAAAFGQPQESHASSTHHHHHIRHPTSTAETNHHSHHFTADTNTHLSASAVTTNAPNESSATQPSTSNSSASLPPFYLFDAPVELRANFMQNQRKLGLPIEHDPNSYHYGETVNGFHPQQMFRGGDLVPQHQGVAVDLNYGGIDGAKSGNQSLNPPQLIDARHGNTRRNKGGQIKNEREQKRAQKITELIEQLRLQMESGGWQVEGRSKFNTLST
jgi:hypothetical protein